MSRNHSRIIAVSGAMNLEQPRHVLTMDMNEPLCDELVRDMERTRAQMPALGQHPAISEEVPQERLGPKEGK